MLGCSVKRLYYLGCQIRKTYLSTENSRTRSSGRGVFGVIWVTFGMGGEGGREGEREREKESLLNIVPRQGYVRAPAP